MDLHGQRVVVLGGTSGIGLATAKAAAGDLTDPALATSS
jgi:NAD(P)-dependent dehydrogenase (short-subunit alcohol dehydrogenase family)